MDRCGHSSRGTVSSQHCNGSNHTKRGETKQRDWRHRVAHQGSCGTRRAQTRAAWPNHACGCVAAWHRLGVREQDRPGLQIGRAATAAWAEPSTLGPPPNILARGRCHPPHCTHLHARILALNRLKAGRLRQAGDGLGAEKVGQCALAVGGGVKVRLWYITQCTAGAVHATSKPTCRRLVPQGLAPSVCMRSCRAHLRR